MSPARVSLAVAASIGFCGCGPRAAASSWGGPRAAPQSETVAATPWVYEVAASPGGDSLSVEAVFPPGTSSVFSVASGAEPFVENVCVREGADWKGIARGGENWHAPECSRGCTLRYNVFLRQAVERLGVSKVASADGHAIVSRPSSWLLRPIDAPPDTLFRFHVASAPGDGFLAGATAVKGAVDTYEAHASTSFDMPFAVFGKIDRRVVGNGDVNVALIDSLRGMEGRLLPWVEASAHAVRSYYGRMPVPGTLVGLLPDEGDAIGEGMTTGGDGAAIMVEVGTSASEKTLDQDWVLVHEMVHTAMPSVGPAHHWLEEGLATYVEPIARVRILGRTPKDVWAEWVRDMPRGEPEPGDLGLDRTETWGRTYYGGALFCLTADVEIRKRTHNTKALDDALRGVLAAGGSIRESWPIERFIEVGDAATGTTVLAELYAKHSTHAVPVDLDDLWKQLGVRSGVNGIEFDDAAPLAAIRRGITSPTGR